MADIDPGNTISYVDVGLYREDTSPRSKGEGHYHFDKGHLSVQYEKKLTRRRKTARLKMVVQGEESPSSLRLPNHDRILVAAVKWSGRGAAVVAFALQTGRKGGVVCFIALAGGMMLPNLKPKEWEGNQEAPHRGPRVGEERGERTSFTARWRGEVVRSWQDFFRRMWEKK